tara:strand:- start:98 stop:559 length:462 start_codon:yes stop_codon:yes gene_type:complete
VELETRAPYYFKPEGVKAVEKVRNATYMGYWCGKTKLGQWAEMPIDVFYEPHPKEEHSHYFGLFLTPGKEMLITDASSCFSEPITGIVEDGIVYASRHRHDSVFLPSGAMIDGGRNYTRTSANPQLVTISVNADKFEFTDIKDDGADGQNSSR